MQLNTKQVRAIVNTIAGFGAQYTDKTLEDKQSKRRSIVYCFHSSTDANNTFEQVQAIFDKMGATNRVTRTGTMADMWRRTGGIEYLRIIADIA